MPDRCGNSFSNPVVDYIPKKERERLAEEEKTKHEHCLSCGCRLDKAGYGSILGGVGAYCIACAKTRQPTVTTGELVYYAYQKIWR